MFCKNKTRRTTGFTLIELSISLLVISLLLGGVLAIATQNVRVEKRNDLNRKLDAIGKALYSYRLKNAKLPCPGNSSLARTNANFLLQADGAAEACHSGATFSSNINTNQATPNVFGGSVPVRTLGLPDDYAFDPWGNLFTYYVDREANSSTNFLSSYGTPSFTDTGSLNVEYEGGTFDDSILAVVLSHGPNGHGAYNGNASGSRISSASTNADELVNCMCTAAAAASSVASITVVLQRPQQTSVTDFKTAFDDVGRIYNKAFFYTYAEKH